MESSNICLRSAKANGKYSKEWNRKLNDDSIRSIDFEQGVDNPDIILSNNSVNTKEIDYSEIYMTAIEN